MTAELLYSKVVTLTPEIDSMVDSYSSKLRTYFPFDVPEYGTLLGDNFKYPGPVVSTDYWFNELKGGTNPELTKHFNKEYRATQNANGHLNKQSTPKTSGKTSHSISSSVIQKMISLPPLVPKSLPPKEWIDSKSPSKNPLLTRKARAYSLSTLGPKKTNLDTIIKNRKMRNFAALVEDDKPDMMDVDTDLNSSNGAPKIPKNYTLKLSVPSTAVPLIKKKYGNGKLEIPGSTTSIAGIAKVKGSHKKTSSSSATPIKNSSSSSKKDSSSSTEKKALNRKSIDDTSNNNDEDEDKDKKKKISGRHRIDYDSTDSEEEEDEEDKNKSSRIQKDSRKPSEEDGLIRESEHKRRKTDDSKESRKRDSSRRRRDDSHSRERRRKKRRSVSREHERRHRSRSRSREKSRGDRSSRRSSRKRESSRRDRDRRRSSSREEYRGRRRDDSKRRSRDDSPKRKSRYESPRSRRSRSRSPPRKTRDNSPSRRDDSPRRKSKSPRRKSRDDSPKQKSREESTHKKASSSIRKENGTTISGKATPKRSTPTSDKTASTSDTRFKLNRNLDMIDSTTDKSDIPPVEEKNQTPSIPPPPKVKLNLSQYTAKKKTSPVPETLKAVASALESSPSSTATALPSSSKIDFAKEKAHTSKLLANSTLHKRTADELGKETNEDGTRSKHLESLIHYTASSIIYLKYFAAVEALFKGDESLIFAEFQKSEKISEFIRANIEQLKKLGHWEIVCLLQKIDVLVLSSYLKWRRKECKKASDAIILISNSATDKPLSVDQALFIQKSMEESKQIMDDTRLMEKKWIEAEQSFKKIQGSTTGFKHLQKIVPFVSLRDAYDNAKATISFLF